MSLSSYNGYQSLTHSHNAYKSTTSLGSATGNKTLGATDYVIGPLGNYY